MEAGIKKSDLAELGMADICYASYVYPLEG